jgi:hypothetical protein
VVQKTPNEGRVTATTSVKSPNQADAVVIHYAPMERAPVEITGDMLAQIARAGMRRARR